MWKLLNRLFGWHYINMVYGIDPEVFRVRKAPNGMLYVKAYGEIISQNKWRHWEPLTFTRTNQ